MEAALAAVPPEVAAAERETRRVAEAEVACDISRSIEQHELSMCKSQAAAIAKQFTLLPALKEWLTAVGMIHILAILNSNGIEQLGDFRGLDKEDLATLDGLDAATLDELWRHLSERGPASAQCAGMELAMARRDTVMQAVQGGGRAKGVKVLQLQRNIDLDSRFKPMMLMPGVPPPLDENDAADLGSHRADEGALTAAYSAMMLAPTRDFTKSVAAQKTNLDAELELMAANRPRAQQKRAPTRRRPTAAQA